MRSVKPLLAGLRTCGTTWAFTPMVILCAVLVSVTLASVILFTSCKKPIGEVDEPAVHGSVLSAFSGSPLAGALVTLKQDGTKIAAAETGADGAYSFTGIEAGEGYTVAASASIYAESVTNLSKKPFFEI